MGSNSTCLEMRINVFLKINVPISTIWVAMVIPYLVKHNKENEEPIKRWTLSSLILLIWQLRQCFYMGTELTDNSKVWPEDTKSVAMMKLYIFTQVPNVGNLC